MLYERWRELAREHARELALHELPAGRRFTFSQLATAAEQVPRVEGPAVFPHGGSAEFVIEVLRGWRDGRVVCPLEPAQPPPDLHRTPPRCVHLKKTSASTGPARWIVFTAEQLAADARNILLTMGLRRDWPNLGVISLAHSYGFSNLVLPLLLHGIPLGLLDSTLPEAVRAAAEQLGPCTVPAVPALWRAWHEAAAVPPTVRLAISAGAPLPRPLEEEVFSAHGLKLHNFYGASECGGIAYDDTEEPRSDPACVGRPMRNVSVAVGEAGCLEVRSPAVGETYWPTPEPTLGGGRFQTSDLAELRQGRLYLRGRATELINVAGRKVSPDWIEQHLSAHPAVRECLVFGVPDEAADRGDLIVACVATRADVSDEALRQFLQARLPAWQLPRRWVRVDSLPTNARGKQSRAQWRARFTPPRTARWPTE
jgi:acyl-CoA synthetase (AMP-forming)/AMP-acid ligase II